MGCQSWVVQGREGMTISEREKPRNVERTRKENPAKERRRKSITKSQTRRQRVQTRYNSKYVHG